MTDRRTSTFWKSKEANFHTTIQEAKLVTRTIYIVWFFFYRDNLCKLFLATAEIAEDQENRGI